MEERDDSQAQKKHLSCSQCRRRKSRCDRNEPCSNCVRYRRDCTYEKLSRAPLTRKYVSEIESELERTRSLLAQREMSSSLLDESNVVLHEASSGNTVVERASDPVPAVHRPSTHRLSTSGNLPSDPVPTFPHPSTHRLSTSGNTVSDPVPAFHHPSTHRLSASGNTAPGPTLAFHRASTHRLSAPGNRPTTAQRSAPRTTLDDTSPSGISASFSMEASPPKLNFDWDERDGTHAGDQLADGMAGLDGQYRQGYMGVTSGAAFLLLTDDDPEHAHDDRAGSEGSEIGLERTIPISVSHLEPFIDAYFSTYHLIYPIVHESTFRAQFMEIIPRPRSKTWEVLAYVIAAVGAFASSETAPVIDRALFDAAKARLAIDMLETGNLALVQALTLISNYVQKRDKPNSGYNFMGIAKRMAMGLGLHKEFPAWHAKPLMLEVRRRVWWCLYNFDVGAIITFSRPLDLPKHGVEVQLPSNVTDAELTPSTTRFPAEAKSTTLYTHLRCQANFHLATSGIYSRMIALPYPTAEEMLTLDDVVLTRFRDGLPSYYHEGVQQMTKFKLAHAILYWRLHNFRILLFRAYVLKSLFSANNAEQERLSPAESTAVDRCFETAVWTITSISTYWQGNKQNVLVCWYSLYFLFQAVMIPVASLRNQPHSDQAPSWKQQIQQALDAMQDMSSLNPSASRCQNTVQKLCGQFLSPGSDRAGSFHLESPQTQLRLMQSMVWPMTDTFDDLPMDMSWLENGDVSDWQHIP